VNQGAAVIITTLERAKQMRVNESQLIFIRGGAAANEPRDYLAREQYVSSDAQDIVLGAARRLLDGNDGDTAALELYSCFPCVPKMTRRVLGLSEDMTPTVTGGLSFFGAPLNNYMTHATCAMVRHLRDGKAQLGLLYGQGEFVTKHHAIVLARSPPRDALNVDYNLQKLVDSRRGAIPLLIENFRGEAIVETYTVLYNRGEPSHGIVIARTPGGERLLARVPGSDVGGIATLTNVDRSPIGVRGHIAPNDDGLLYWS
jgi:acetyl-CoA C-acetyltransferase